MDAQKQHPEAQQGLTASMIKQLPRPLFAGHGKQESKCNAAANPMPDFLTRVPRPLFARKHKEDPQPSTEIAPVPKSTHVASEAEAILPATPQQPVLPAAPEQPTLPAATQQQDLPAVISVRKSKKGCAVVLLRDLDILERCVLQRVAIIDGVCVEMSRHTKKSRSEEDVQPTPGIFVAWGIRVERRIPVSEEGIEEYFNSLAGKPCPEGLVASPPFQESHMSFPLSSDAFAPLSWSICSTDANKEEILSSGYCQPDLIKASWAAKDRLDALWGKPPPPMARSLMTRIARAQLFPRSGTTGKGDMEETGENRAGDKLAELVSVTDLLDDIPAGSAFLDLCGGPGAWSQHLLSKRDLSLRGFGFTLKANAGEAGDWKAQEKDEWYEDLYQHSNWTALWGADGTGDLLKLGNLEHLVKKLAKEQVLLCVADGGFSDDGIPQNLLELYFYRLFLAELLTAVSCLSPGGKFVCKLYSSFSDATAGLLFLTTRLFESVEIVKPISSKATGPERYLVAAGFRDDAESSAIQGALSRAHAAGRGASPLVTPLLTPLLLRECLAQDQRFTASMKAMVTAFCERQTIALNAVVDRADFLEDMAMESAVCIDPWSRRPPSPKFHESLPTPARSGAWKGKGKGKGGWRHRYQ